MQRKDKNGNIEIYYPITNLENVVGSNTLSKNGHTHVKSEVGLSNVDNTSDDIKNVYSATRLTTARTINGVSFNGTADITIYDATKEPKIPVSTTEQYFRGDKTWQNLASAVRTTTLLGLSTATSNTISASDTILSAFGKLQAQASKKLSLSGGTMTGNITMNSYKVISSAIPTSDNDYTNKKYVDGCVDSNKEYIDDQTEDTKDYINEQISKKQDKLISGTNIKTVNGESLLGDGNITISGGAGGLRIEDAFEFDSKMYSGLFLQYENGEYVFKPGECGDYYMHFDGVEMFIHPIGIMIDEATNKRYKIVVIDGEQTLQEVA